jgi:hypothetical protein
MGKGLFVNRRKKHVFAHNFYQDFFWGQLQWNFLLSISSVRVSAYSGASRRNFLKRVYSRHIRIDSKEFGKTLVPARGTSTSRELIPPLLNFV